MTFKKLAVAACVASSFAAPVLAQSSVEIYGRLYPYVVDEKGSGPTAATETVSTIAGKPTGVSGVGETRSIRSGNSRIGFKGKEDLGGDLKAIFQLEGGVAVETGITSLFQRNTYVGLESGKLGTIKLGVMDTIFKDWGDTLGVLGISSGTFMSTSDVLRKTGFGTSSASSFHLRRANAFQYESPEIADFQFGVQYSTDEAPSTAPRNPKVISLGLRYDAGPLYVAVTHEIHKDLFGGSRNVASAMRNNADTDPTHSTDKATQIAVEWRVNKVHKLEFDYIRKQYNENATVAGRFESYKNNAFLVAWEAKWTPQISTAAHIVKADAGSCTRVAAVCDTMGLEATKYLVAAGYSFSKRTMAFASASVIKNGKSARFNNSEFGRDVAPGEDIRQIAVGVIHRF